MSIQRYAVRLANALLAPLGARIVKSATDLLMSSALQRIQAHGFRPAAVIDVGASDGKWSRLAMDALPEARFLAVEPLREREAALAGNKRRYARFDYALCAAAGPGRSHVNLDVAPDLDGSTVDGSGGVIRPVPCATLDELVAERGLGGPYLLKFDTHGYELPILDGARQVLEDTDVIIMEVYNFHVAPGALLFPEMCQHLGVLGFRCYDMAEPLSRSYDGAFWQADFFFCRADAAIFDHDGFA